MWRKNEIASQLEGKSDVILEVVGSEGSELVSILRPEPATLQKGRRMSLGELHRALLDIPKTNRSAVVEIQAFGYSLSPVTNTVRTLRRNGFDSIDVVVVGSGFMQVVPRDRFALQDNTAR
jgi:hypothetical protein